MRLDYHARADAFSVRLPRSEGTKIHELMADHGLDFSMPDSTAETAVLFTHEPFAACAFADDATPRALQQLAPLLERIAASWAPESGAHIAVPSDQALHPFQKASVEYALKTGRALIADQPGLGKTCSAIAFANETRAKRVLVICPASIRHQWAFKIGQWTTMRPRLGQIAVHVHKIMHGKSGVAPEAPWTICSYDLARAPAILDQLHDLKPDLVIVDEAHYLKNNDTKRTQALFGKGGIAENAVGLLALTGTPLPNRPRECYTLARAIDFASIDWMSEDRFNRRFNPSRAFSVENPATGEVSIHVDERTGRTSELQARLRANLMVRHLKREVMTSLQTPVYDLIHLDADSPAIRAALDAESLLDIDPENLEGADAEILGHIAVMRRLMGEAMAPMVADYVATLLDGGEEKIVLFAWHHSTMDILQAKLARYGVVRIDGKTSSNDKERRKEAFIKDPRIRVCLGNLQSMGVGTDGLQLVCSHAVIAEPAWTPGDNIQAFDRLDRDGQTCQVLGDICVVVGSIAERILASALRKLQVIHKALDRKQIV